MGLRGGGDILFYPKIWVKLRLHTNFHIYRSIGSDNVGLNPIYAGKWGGGVTILSLSSSCSLSEISLHTEFQHSRLSRTDITGLTPIHISSR